MSTMPSSRRDRSYPAVATPAVSFAPRRSFRCYSIYTVSQLRRRLGECNAGLCWWVRKCEKFEERNSFRLSGFCTFFKMSALSCLLLVLLLVYASGAEDGGSRKFRDFLQEWPTPGTGPYFDTSINSNITGLVGKTVLLHCRVKNLGNRTVSWVRHRDIHLLTVGRYTYTSDQRFEAIHTPHTEEWTLRIRYPQRKDSGIYECQISTTPPIGHSVYLTIVEPITEILGGPDLFINMGSTINLTCLVRYAPEPPPTMLWAHNAQVINFDSPRGGISLVTEKGQVTTSRLLIQKAVQSDSGLYTCTPSNANAASVRVHILNEHPAAMHHGHGALTRLSHATILLSLVFCLVVRPPT